STREMFRSILQSDGYVVTDTHDGAQALDIAEGLMPELILLDIHLPSLNGKDVLGMLKQNPNVSGIPVILCTVDEPNEEIMQLGAVDYIRKPVTPDDLLKKIRKVFAMSPGEE